MEISDDRSFKEYYNSIQREMKKIGRLVSGFSGSENRFQRDKHRLDYFAKFLTKYQYFNNEVKKKPFLEIFKEIFLFLSNWERNYTPEMEKTDESRNFIEKRNNFRYTTRGFTNQIIETFFLFNRDDDEVGVFHKYKSQGSKYYSLDSLFVLYAFSKDYSLLLIDLITYECQRGMISNSLRELLDKTKWLDHLQVLCAEEWYVLSQEIHEKDSLRPTPILHIAFSKLRFKKGRPRGLYAGRQEFYNDIPETLQSYFSQIIDQKKLITQSPELTKRVKAEELLSITEVIKELLTELREGDEIVEDDTLAIIEENRPLEYLSQSELGEYFKQLLIELPDFEYVRLKKSFRRKASQKTELLTNIDSVYLQSIPSSLKNIEKSLLEIQQSQRELLDSTQQLQELLESQFELVIENQTKIEEYLFEKLGSDFEKIKHLWNMYKEKQITSKEFVQQATKILGTKFSKAIVGLLIFIK